MAKSHNLAKVQHTNLHRTQITNTSKYMMAKLQLAKLKGNHCILIKKYIYLYIQITVPEENVATTKHGATVILGEAKQALLDGDTTNYDMERGMY